MSQTLKNGTTQVIKEVVWPDRFPGEAHCCIRTRTYTKTFGYFVELAAIIREDFPSIDDENINIEKYGGQNIKRMYGAEFVVPVESIESIPALAYYETVKNHEYTL